MLFTYLHLAPAPELTQALIDSGATCVAYETVETDDHRLPLLAPMSEVAGRLAPQMGAHALEKAHGGRGVLLGGVAGVPPGKVAVLGGGIVGYNAALIAVGMQADVWVLDRSIDRMRELDPMLDGRATVAMSNTLQVEEAISEADLVIGAVLVHGARAPKLVTREMLGLMKPGSVLVDVAIDQGGCFETSRPTTHSDPTYEVDGIVHYCVANMPGAVPMTSTRALTNATLPYVEAIADRGLAGAVRSDRALARGVNVMAGRVTYEPVARDLGHPVHPALGDRGRRAGLRRGSLQPAIRWHAARQSAHAHAVAAFALALALAGRDARRAAVRPASGGTPTSLVIQRQVRDDHGELHATTRRPKGDSNGDRYLVQRRSSATPRGSSASRAGAVVGHDSGLIVLTSDEGGIGFVGVATLPGGKIRFRRCPEPSPRSRARRSRPSRAAPAVRAGERHASSIGPGDAPLNTYRAARRRMPAYGLTCQLEQHAVIAERVRLDALEVEELRDALVERAAQLGVDLGRDGRALDLAEAERREEVALEREHEDARDAELAHGRDQPLDEQRADALAAHRGIDGDGADLGDVLPQRVDGAAADDAPAVVGDPEVLHVLVQLHALLGQQDAVAGVELDQVVDRGHVGRARAAQRDGAHVRLQLPDADARVVEDPGVAPDRVVRALDVGQHASRARSRGAARPGRDRAP